MTKKQLAELRELLLRCKPIAPIAPPASQSAR